MKKFISLTLALLLATTPLTALAYSDVSSSDWFNDNVNAVSEANIINGYEDGTFRPYGNVTYAEALKITSAVHANLTNGWDGLNNTRVIEDDYKDHWAGKYVQYAVNEGIASSKVIRRDFDKPMLRGALSEYLANALPQANVTEINDSANAPEKYMTAYVEKLYKNGIMIGNGESFDLYSYVTRAEVAAMSDRLMNPAKRVSDTPTSQPTTPPVETPEPKPPLIEENTLTVIVEDSIKDYIASGKGSCEIHLGSLKGTEVFKISKDTYNASTGKCVFKTKAKDTAYDYRIELVSNDSTFTTIKYGITEPDYLGFILVDNTKAITISLHGGEVPDNSITLNMQDEVYEKLVALKKDLPEGMDWRGDKGYHSSPVLGRGAGCNGFAYKVSDELFGNQPAYEHIDYKNGKVGDILTYRYFDDDGSINYHLVVIMKVHDDGYTVAEGNWNQTVHWGRKITWSELDSAAKYTREKGWLTTTIATRYADADTSNAIPYVEDVTKQRKGIKPDWYNNVDQYK